MIKNNVFTVLLILLSASVLILGCSTIVPKPIQSELEQLFGEDAELVDEDRGNRGWGPIGHDSAIYSVKNFNTAKVKKILSAASYTNITSLNAKSDMTGLTLFDSEKKMDLMVSGYFRDKGVENHGANIFKKNIQSRDVYIGWLDAPGTYFHEKVYVWWYSLP